MAEVGNGWGGGGVQMVHRIGFEPTTPCSEDKCSNPLSYRCVKNCARTAEATVALLVRSAIIAYFGGIIKQ